MLKLTSLKGNKKFLKASQILEIKKTPDTVLILLNGNCMIVRETVEEIMRMIFMNPKAMDIRASEVLS